MSGSSAVYGRWGGEEFAVVFSDISPEKLNAVSEELRTRVADEKFADVGTVTCSIGASFLNSSDTFETWFDRADRAVYTAKSNGRNCVCII